MGIEQDTQGAREVAMDPREGQWPLSDAVGETIPDRPPRPNVVAAMLAHEQPFAPRADGSIGRSAGMAITSSDRDDLITNATITARKTARIVGMVATVSGSVLTDRGPMAFEPGDIIATNHPDDDPGSDVWPISRERFDATYEIDSNGVRGRRFLGRIDEAGPQALLRAAIEKVKGEPAWGTHSDEDRQLHIAVTALEDALLWLNGKDVL